MTTPANSGSVNGLGIAGVVFALVFWPAGIAISIVAIVRSRRAGRVCRPAVLGRVRGILELGAETAAPATTSAPNSGECAASSIWVPKRAAPATT